MRRLAVAACLLLALAVAVLPAGCSKGEFVGSRLSNKYHTPGCPWAEAIDEDRQVWFADEAEAEAAGYVPGTCITGE